jgi:hypothetical protein
MKVLNIHERRVSSCVEEVSRALQAMLSLLLGGHSSDSGCD